MQHTADREPDDALFDSLRLELRRGSLVLAVLGQLRVEHYGYSLRQALGTLGIDIDEGTLYPLLRRLESQGLLTSEWREEARRTKRFYCVTPAGRRTFKRLLAEWDTIHQGLLRVTGQSPESL